MKRIKKIMTVLLDLLVVGLVMVSWGVIVTISWLLSYPTFIKQAYLILSTSRSK